MCPFFMPHFTFALCTFEANPPEFHSHENFHNGSQTRLRKFLKTGILNCERARGSTEEDHV